jgi:hypothetical protein
MANTVAEAERFGLFYFLPWVATLIVIIVSIVKNEKTSKSMMKTCDIVDQFNNGCRICCLFSVKQGNFRANIR